MLSQEFFKQTDIGRKLTTECFDAVYPILAKNTFEKSFPAGDVIVPVGATIEYLMFLKEGTVKSYFHTNRGERIFFFYFPQNHSVGLLSALSKRYSIAEYIADKNCTMVYVPRENFTTALRLIPAFEGIILKHIADAADRQVEISILSRCKYAKDRVCMYLYFHHRNTQSSIVPIHFTLEALANYLGITRSVLSKELHALEDEHVIKLQKQEITIIDIEKLKTYI